MKILYVIEHISAKGGLERIVIDKMNALSEDEALDVTLLTIWKDTDRPAYPVGPRVGQACLGIPRPGSLLGMMGALPRVLHRYNREVKCQAPDIVVYFRAMGALLAACSTWKGRSIFETHSARQYCNHKWLYPWMERKVNAVVCLTQDDARHYFHAARVEVIPNFTSMTCPPSAGACRSNRRCSFVGRLCPEKNPMRLLGLWKEIASRMPGWTLDIYGSGELEERMKEEIRWSALSETVTMHGFAEDVSRIYAETDILLLTSLTEGFPMVIIEAMRCGVPVVSTDCPCGPAEVIENGKTGMLVPLDDDPAYVDAVCRLMRDTGMRERMGREAVECSRHYCVPEILARWKTLFADLT